MSEVKIGGTAQKYCIHNRAKNQTKELPYNGQVQEAFVCICCLNLFVKFIRENNTTPICTICKGERRF